MPKALLAVLLWVLSAASPAQTYQPTAESLAQHPAAPPWLADAKLGIYFHWGPYSVPAYYSEWYPRHMHQSNHPVHHHHLKTYGPLKQFGYHDFVPRFTAEHFDPEEWAQLFKDSGARFAGPVAEHHDGFSMWDSDVTPWNAKDAGPKRDILGELFASLERRGLKTIATFHHARNLLNTPDNSGHYAPSWGDMPPRSTDPQLRLLYGNLPAEQWYETIWMAKLKEVVDGYRPDIVWFDSWLDRIPESYRYRFCAYYLNRARDWGKDVAIIRKQDDLPLSFSINDHEKSREAAVQPRLWMTDDTLSTGSWSYTHNLQIKPIDKVLHALIDTVAKNGVVLLNISPKADGTIPDDQRRVLGQLGDWLRINGEAVYDTRPWRIAAEGPVTEPTGGFKDRKKFLRLTYSPRDIRYTRNAQNTTLYATAMGWPGESAQLKSLAGVDPQTIESVHLLGDPTPLDFESTPGGLNVRLGPKPGYDHAFPLRIRFHDQIPTAP